MTKEMAIEILNRYDVNFMWDDGESIPADAVSEAVQMAVKALKAQEPVKPKKNDVEFAGLKTWDWACPECNCVLIYRANYCSCCGKPVKWDA